MFPSFSDALIIWWFIKIADTTDDDLDDLGGDWMDWYKIYRVSRSCQYYSRDQTSIFRFMSLMPSEIKL